MIDGFGLLMHGELIQIIFCLIFSYYCRKIVILRPTAGMKHFPPFTSFSNALSFLRSFQFCMYTTINKVNA